MIQKSVIMHFPRTLVDKPIISHLVRNCDVEVNILQAHISPDEDGHLFAILKGGRNEIRNALAYLQENGVRAILPAKNLVWDEKKCTHCGACVGQCLPSAFAVDAATRKVVFDAQRCIACELCIPACSYGAIESINENLRRKGEL
jgi:ferredoxin